jgi:hypothetical protein
MLPDVQALIDDGSIEECPSCGALSAYAYQDSNIPGEEDYEADSTDVYMIGACSGMGEWQCGNCRTYWVSADGPLNHPCYTHSED